MCVSARGVSNVADVGNFSASPSLYDILGVSMKATHEDIRMSYRKLARLWHPDRHGGADHAKRKFQQIQYAYEVLSNERSRAFYDLRYLRLLDVEDYLNRFKDLILTANGLGLSLGDLDQQAEHGSGLLGESDRGPSTVSCGQRVKAA